MEGNQAGKADTTPTRAADFDMDELLWPSHDFELKDTGDPDGELVWPQQSPQTEKSQPKSTLILAAGVFIIATLFTFALGPVQLVLLATTKDYDFVITNYYPAVLRITLLSSGIFMLVNIVTLILALRDSKRHASVIATLCAGSIALFAVAWIAAFVIELQPNQLTIIILPLILLFWFIALMISKSYSTEPKPGYILKTFIILLILCSGAEIIFDGFYISTKTTTETASVDLAKLVADERAARLDNIPEQLSKFTFALCQGSYSIVFFDEAEPMSGLFECQNSHEVYSITDPDLSQESDRFAHATYLGQTSQTEIETYFPSAKYLYHDLSESELDLPNELIVLLPSDSEEDLIDQNLSTITELAKVKPNLKLNIFYTNTLDPEISTRDYILTTAVGTISLVDWLPHGKVFTGADTANEALRYNFSLDRTLQALSTLGMDPSAYSEQVRDAITTRRHLQINTSTLNLDDESTLREQLLASFVGTDQSDAN